MKKNISIILTLLAMIIIIMLVMAFNERNPIEYSMYTYGDVEYNRGKVIEVVKESLQEIQEPKGAYVGVQEIVVEMLDGEHKGELVEINHSLSYTFNVLAKKGKTLVIRCETPKGLNTVFSVYNYDRSFSIFMGSIIFILICIFIGGKKGIYGIIGLAFTMFMIIAFLLKIIYIGKSPIFYTIITIGITSTISFVLLNGLDKKTISAIVSNFIGITLSGITFFFMSKSLNLSSFNISDIESLSIISNNTGMIIGQLLFVGVLISSQGAVMDVALSLSSSLFELHKVKPNIGKLELVKSGMNIGKDMIGTMVNTLILAFTGTSIITLLVLISYGVNFNQLINSDFIALELAQGLSASIGVVLTIPICTGFFSIIMRR